MCLLITLQILNSIHLLITSADAIMIVVLAVMYAWTNNLYLHSKLADISGMSGNANMAVCAAVGPRQAEMWS